MPENMLGFAEGVADALGKDSVRPDAPEQSDEFYEGFNLGFVAGCDRIDLAPEVRLVSLTYEEAARVLGCSDDYCAHLVCKGYLEKGVRVGGKLVSVTLRSILARQQWVRDGRPYNRQKNYRR